MGHIVLGVEVCPDCNDEYIGYLKRNKIEVFHIGDMRDYFSSRDFNNGLERILRDNQILRVI